MTDVKKILVITQCYPPAIGGIETLMRGLVDAFSYDGHACYVLADGKARSTRQVTYFSGPKPWRRFQKKKAVVKALAERQYDAIFCDTWKSIEVLPEDDIYVPVICLAHGAELSPDYDEDKQARIRTALGRAKWVVANSDFTAKRAEAYAAPAHKVTTITPGVHPLRPADPKFVLRNSPVITTICRLEPRKGVDRLIAAMPDVLQQYPDARLVIAGTGQDRKRLEALAEQQSCSEAILFLGQITEAQKTALLQQSDVFAMPVREDGASIEGFGLVYLEAALCGVPSLAGSAGGTSDAVLHNQTGYICDGDDQADVTHGLLTLLQSDRSEWSDALALFVQDSLWSQKIEHYLALFYKGTG